MGINDIIVLIRSGSVFLIDLIFGAIKAFFKATEGCFTVMIWILVIGLTIYGYVFVFIIFISWYVIKGIIWLVKKIINEKKGNSNKKNINNRVNDNKRVVWDYQKIRKYKVKKRDNYHIEFYVNKKYRFLLNKDKMNYKVLGLENSSEYDVWLVDKEGNEYYFEDDTDSLEYYGELFLKLFRYCNNEIRIVISSDKKILYEFVRNGNKILLNGYGDTSIRNMYNRYISFIRDFYEKIDDPTVSDCNSIWKVFDDIGLDSDEFCRIFDKVDNERDINIYEMPYIKELWLLAKELTPIVDKEISLMDKEIRDVFGDGEYHVVREEVMPKNVKKEKKKEKPKKLSWKEEEFEREAKLWGLSEEDKQIAKAEGFTPADFVEAEERMDDILDTDEWEDKKR